MNVDVSIPSALRVDVEGPYVPLQFLPGSQRPFPQSVWPISGAAGTLLQVAGAHFTRFGVVTWVRVGGLLYTASNGGLEVADDSRLTFTTRAGMPTGQLLDVIAGAGSSTDASHTGVLPSAFTATS